MPLSDTRPRVAQANLGGLSPGDHHDNGRLRERWTGGHCPSDPMPAMQGDDLSNEPWVSDSRTERVQGGRVRQLTPQETVTYLLDTLVEVRTVAGRDGNGSDGLTPLMSRLYHQGSYRRLEDQLRAMRDSLEAHNGVRLRKLWWHLTRWYLCEWRIGTGYRYVAAKNGKGFFEPVRQRERIVPSICHTRRAKDLRDVGLLVLTDRMVAGGTIWLPEEILEVVAA